MSSTEMESVKKICKRRKDLGKPSTVWRRIRNGDLPYVRCGGRVFLIEQQIDDWAANGGGKFETPEERAAREASDPNL